MPITPVSTRPILAIKQVLGQPGLHMTVAKKKNHNHIEVLKCPTLPFLGCTLNLSLPFCDLDLPSDSCHQQQLLSHNSLKASAPEVQQQTSTTQSHLTQVTPQITCEEVANTDRQSSVLGRMGPRKD